MNEPRRSAGGKVARGMLIEFPRLGRRKTNPVQGLENRPGERKTKRTE